MNKKKIVVMPILIIMLVICFANMTFATYSIEDYSSWLYSTEEGNQYLDRVNSGEIGYNDKEKLLVLQGAGNVGLDNSFSYYFMDPTNQSDSTKGAYIVPKEGVSKENWETFLGDLEKNGTSTAYTVESLQNVADIYFVADEIENYDPNKDYTRWFGKDAEAASDATSKAAEKAEQAALKWGQENKTIVKNDYGQDVPAEGSKNAQQTTQEARDTAREKIDQKISGEEETNPITGIETEEGKKDAISIQSILNTANNFIKNGSSEPEDPNVPAGLDNKAMKNSVNSLNRVVLIIGIVVAVVVGLILGIKFIIGGIEEKAEIKGMVVPYVVGVIVLFAAYSIWQLFVNLFQYNI